MKPLGTFSIQTETQRDFLTLLASLAPRLVNGLKLRPAHLRRLPWEQRDGLRTQLTRLRAEIDATLAEIDDAVKGGAR